MTNGPAGRFGLPRRDDDGAQPPPPPPPAGGGFGGGFSDDDDEPQPPREDLTLSIQGVRARQSPDVDGEVEVELTTSRGIVFLDMTIAEGGVGVAVCLGGAGGGNEGPAGGLYRRLGPHLLGLGISTVRVRYREAGEWEECLMDALAACSFLKGVGAQHAVMVGASFGGAVAIKAGEVSPLVSAVCSLATQRYGTFSVERLGKPLLLIHGSRDEVLDKAASEDVYDRAEEPKQLVILQGGTHSLKEHPDEVFTLVSEFVLANADGAAPPA